MKIIINKKQFKLIKETIRAHEAYKFPESLQTVIDGKRNVCWLSNSEIDEDEINNLGLNYIIVPKHNSNDFSYAIFNENGEAQAKELADIAKKYGGFLSVKATEEDSRRIGELLEYHPDDINDYILRNRYINTDIITCRECGHRWHESTAGWDKFICHICDTDNSNIYAKSKR